MSSFLSVGVLSDKSTSNLFGWTFKSFSWLKLSHFLSIKTNMTTLTITTTTITINTTGTVMAIVVVRGEPK